MSSRKYCNDIDKLLNGNGDIINEASQLEEEAIAFFTDSYNSDGNSSHFPDVTPKYLLHANSEDILLAQVCIEDIKNHFQC